MRFGFFKAVELQLHADARALFGCSGWLPLVAGNRAAVLALDFPARHVGY